MHVKNRKQKDGKTRRMTKDRQEVNSNLSDEKRRVRHAGARNDPRRKADNDA